MSVVTVTEPVPARLEGIYQFVRGKTVNDTDLRITVSPPALLRREENVLGSGPTTAPRDIVMLRTLAAARDLHLLSQDADTWNTPHDFDDADELRDYLEAAVLGTTTGNTNQRNVARAIAWFLTLNPSRPVTPSDAVAAAIKTECKGNDFDVSNDERVRQLGYWLTYLGFAWRFSAAGTNYIQPDATPVLERHLFRANLPAEERIALGEALARVALSCPVFEGGDIRSEVEALLGDTRRRDERTLSPVTSLALSRLEAQKVLMLESLSDAVGYQLTYPERRSCSHITLKAQS